MAIRSKQKLKYRYLWKNRSKQWIIGIILPPADDAGSNNEDESTFMDVGRGILE